MRCNRGMLRVSQVSYIVTRFGFFFFLFLLVFLLFKINNILYQSIYVSLFVVF
jgi:hypothetical protein